MSRPKGFKHTEKTKQLMRKHHKGFHRPHTQEEKDKISEKMRQWHETHKHPLKGQHHSKETKEKMSIAHQGKNNANWKGGITLSVRLFRKSKQYQQWCTAILKRDNYTCKIKNCNNKSNIVHHVLAVKDYPELRLIISNGQVLCEKHHKRKHKKL